MVETKEIYDPETSKYLPALDSVRGLAFIFVFLYHTVHITAKDNILLSFIAYINRHLYWGLDIFFVLSSFLLTWLALKEYNRRTAFSIKRYFVRRILRIWPLYFLIIGCAFLVFPFLANLTGFDMSLPEPLFYIFFISNFYYLPHVFFLTFLWTISVEEQFYLLWGICLKFFARYLKWIILGLIVISVVFGILRVAAEKRFYTNTLFYFFNFGCGALAALVFFTRNSGIRKWVTRMNRLKTLIFYSLLPVQFIAFFLLSRQVEGVTSDLIGLLAKYFFVLYVSFFLVEQTCNSSRWSFLERNRWTIFTGKISYGLYCYHGITITFVNILAAKFFQHSTSALTVPVIFALNYLVAYLSYFYFELPFLKLKSRFR